MNSIQKIESAVYAIRPELKEPQFGCWVEFKGKKERIISEHKGYFTTPTIFGNNTKEQIEKHCTILGCPITISDILLCLGEKFAIRSDGTFLFDYSKEEDGEFLWGYAKTVIIRPGIFSPIKYNLRLSPYEQSSEVLDFIADNCCT